MQDYTNGLGPEPIVRKAMRFESNGTECASWHYPGTNGACVVMAAGLAVTKEAGTDRFASAFARAGFSVLAFDYRRLGESGGHPRQIVRIREQLDDWRAALAFARGLPDVDPRRVAIWGFSVSGGHVFRVAAADSALGAAIAHAPAADGLDAALNAMRSTPLLAGLRLHIAALRDVLHGALGRDPVLVPLTGPRGSVASITTADSRKGPAALNPDGAYPWQQEVAARSAIRVAYYRPGRVARKITAPLLVLAYDDDGVTPPGPAIRAGQQAPLGEVVRLPGGHYEAFMGGYERALDVVISFLRRHLVQVFETPRIHRFHAYAAAFEAAYESDDWSLLEPYLTEDATSELNGARVAGRAAVLASFRDSVATFDRRFDSRRLSLTHGPTIEDGQIHIIAVVRYERAALAPLEVTGEEWFTFEGDRIKHHVDRVVNVAEVMEYLARHGEALRPLP